MFTFPAGLVLYFSVNNLLTILQQWLIYRKKTTKRAAHQKVHDPTTGARSHPGEPMSDNQVITEGNNVAEAIAKAAEALGIPAEQVDHKLDRATSATRLDARFPWIRSRSLRGLQTLQTRQERWQPRPGWKH